MAQMQFLNMPTNQADVVYTPDDIAKEIVEHFNPTGRILEPCKGDGAFMRYLPPNTEWCEIKEGRDFFAWNEKVDWIISNPPFSDYYAFLEHAFSLADDVVYLLTTKKPFQSLRNLQLIYSYGGIVEIFVIGRGSEIGWDMGFAIGAIHFQRNYKGSIAMSFRERLTPREPDSLKAGDSSLPESVKSESNLPA
jgi:hypothetical protein